MGRLDCYSESLSDLNANATARFLHGEGVARLFFVCLTHPHDDHYLGMAKLMEEFKPAEFWRFGCLSHEHVRRLLKYYELRAGAAKIEELSQSANELIDVFGKALEGAKNKTMDVCRANSRTNPHPKRSEKPTAYKIECLSPTGRQIERYEGAVWECIGPDGRIAKKLSRSQHNDISLVLKITYGNTKIILGGDLEKTGWEEVVEDAGESDLSVCTVKVSHHGSENGYCDRLWEHFAGAIDVIRNKGYNSRMMTYARLQSDRREFLALTGLTLQEFQLLLNAFTPAYERRYPKDRTLADRPRQRCAGGGRKGVLDCPEQKLLFLLVYLKTYPLQVLMGELFGLSQPGVNYWIHRLLPVLRDALDSLSVLPERNPNDFARSQTATGTEPRLIIDGTERRRQRPKSPEKQALHYSGKKKAHTDKNVVIVDLRRKCIGFLSRTYVGKTHDKKIADSEGISYPPKAELYKDTGFQGYEPAVTRTCQAKKKAAPRGTHSR